MNQKLNDSFQRLNDLHAQQSADIAAEYTLAEVQERYEELGFAFPVSGDHMTKARAL